MKTPRGLSRLLAILLCLGLCGGCSPRQAPPNIVSATRYIGQARGFWLAPKDWDTGEDTAAQQKNLADAVAFASAQQLNTIFFEVAENSDPLTYLCEQAGQNKVQVFALLPLTSDPADEKQRKQFAADTAALLKKHDVAGLVVAGLERSAQPVELIQTVAAALQRTAPTAALGVAFDSTGSAAAAVAQLAAAGTVQLVLADMPSATDSYLPVLTELSGQAFGVADLYTINHCEERATLEDQLLANGLSGAVAGAVLHPYATLRQNTAEQNAALVGLLAPAQSSYTPPDLSIGTTLAVSYPSSGVTVTDKQLWLMGTSDPAQPLLLDGKELTRMGSAGTFGAVVDLEMGENSFTLSQGDKRASVTVYRKAAGVITISKIPTGSLFPTSPLGLDSNQTFEVAVVGPSGAAITATFAGQTAVLAQAGSAATGVPATFKGSFTLSPANYPTDAVTDAGGITYLVSYNGGHEVQKSGASIFVAGKNVPLTVEILDGQYVASVLTNVSHEDNFVQSLKAGARARVAGRVMTTRSGNPEVAYKLSGGGYVMANKTTVVTDPAACTSDITAITHESGADWEEYTLAGGQPAVLTGLAENTLTLRFLDTAMTADPVATMQGGLVTAVTRTDTKDGVELALTFADGTLWGYDVTHGDGVTKLYLAQKPKAATTIGKPLTGWRILLDPGHGGTDPGAMGVAGVAGPTEAVLNLAVANAVRFRLEQLGATVRMTRVDESRRVSLDERTFQAEAEKPHIFVAIHHNSTALSKDITKTRRMEAYYWEQIAQPLAQNLMTTLGGALGRTTTEPENAYYYVTRLTFAPAVLYEMGFIVNPAEYEESCQTTTLLRAANGMAQAVVRTVLAEPTTAETVDNGASGVVQ